MRRKIEQALVEWKNSPTRKPLLLNGARQVGKSYVLEWLGKNYFSNYVHINLELAVSVSQLFDQDLTPDKVIQFLEVYSGQAISAENTLVILDEIQSSERALMALKMFAEEAPQYAIAAAGSLLGVAIHREKYSFPVGKVDELQLYPLDFEEFLWATGHDNLAVQIRGAYVTNEPLPELIHQMAIDIYKRYLIVGGMPAVVQHYIDTQSLISIQTYQNNIVNEYTADMAKYASSSTSVKIRACYNSIPVQLAKENQKFQYKVVKKGGSATMFGEAIDWLQWSGTVLKCEKVDDAIIPLAGYVSMADFKLYMGDVGLLTLKSGMPSQLILSAHEDNTYIGGVTENYVAMHLAAANRKLYYWRSEGIAEIDFLLQDGVKIIPIEVKSGVRTRSRSLSVFVEKYHPEVAYRVSQKNFGLANGIKSVPLYAVFCI